MTTLTIFDLINKINTKQFQAINDPEIEKQFVPFLTQRWLTGTSNDAQVYIVNEVVNPYTFSIHKHKRLLWKLMCVATEKNKQRYVWKKTAPQAKSNVLVNLIAEYYKCSSREAIDYLHLLGENDFFEMAEFLGKDKEEIAKIKKNLKDV